jgi:hypothetical protein
MTGDWGLDAGLTTPHHKKIRFLHIFNKSLRLQWIIWINDLSNGI